jgi:hypothetical protein
MDVQQDLLKITNQPERSQEKIRLNVICHPEIMAGSCHRPSLPRRDCFREDGHQDPPEGRRGRRIGQGKPVQ